MGQYLDFKEAKCKNCYKCLKTCPVKAIRIEDNQAKIINDRCILCGKCTLICPQNAKEVHSDLNKIKNLLNSKKVIASLAPSFISNFHISSFQAIEKALKELGFIHIEETAKGAYEVSKEYLKLLKKKEYKNFITSCCPAINRMIALYYPQALKYLAKVDSPIIAHAKLLKEEYPDYKIVFIGPCLAKKRECYDSKIVDAVLTFEELDLLFKENNIILEDIKEEDSSYYNLSRYYPINRGIIKSFKELNKDYSYIAIDGLERAKNVLEEIDDLENVFLEINACTGACIGGPCRINAKHEAIIANAKVRNYVLNNKTINKDAENDIDLNHEFKEIIIEQKEINEEAIKEVLAKTGKYKKEDELNCGACGYNTCREKAWAVLNGYADINMCLPYMRERAENVTYEIMKASPYGIVIFNSDSIITDINSKAKNLLGISLIDLNVDSILNYFNETEGLLDIINEKKNVFRKRIIIENKNIDYSITYMSEQNTFLLLMRDVSDRVEYLNELKRVKEDTLSITDEVIKKQMRVAQEIASLLGETTAETKVALANLKKYLKDEGNE